MPYGCVLCVVELYDVVNSEAFHGATPMKISIGESFGRDHGTVMHNCRSVEDRIATDQKVPGRLGAFAHHHAAHLNAVSNGMTYG